MKTIWLLCKLIVWVTAPFLLASSVIVFWSHRSEISARPEAVNFVGGLLVGGTMWILPFRGRKFLSTFIHEWNHLVCGMAFLKRPVSLKVEECGNGEVYMSGSPANFVVTLAPYCVPVLSILWSPLVLLVRDASRPMTVAIAGMLLGMHFVDAFRDFRTDQPDIANCGVLFSFLFCLLLNVVLCGLVSFGVVMHDFGGILRVLGEIISNAKGMAEALRSPALGL